MNKTKVLWNNEVYDHFVNEKNQDVLERVDKDGFKVRMTFTGEKTWDEFQDAIIRMFLATESSN